MALFALLGLLTQVEVQCWNQGTDPDGSFRCEHVVITAKSGELSLVPELAALDAGGPKTAQQADRACQAMGFPFALRFALAQPQKEVAQVVLEEPGEGTLLFRSTPFVQHLHCAVR